MNIPLCDLHTHSFHSDGTLSPEAILRRAEELGLAAVALCDHNTISGLPEFLGAGENSPVEAVAGVEITAEFEGREVHVVGLFLPESGLAPLKEFLARQLQEKEQANLALFRRLTDAGYRLSLERILADGKDSVNRVQFARELVRRGYISTVAEGFQKILSEEAGFFVPPRRPEAADVLLLLRSLGAVSVLAHPFLNLSEEALRIFLPLAKEQGLVALETRYSLFDEGRTRLAEALAAEFGLLQSGGSDFHGENKPDIALGSGRGDLQVPAAFFEALKASARQ